MLHYAFYESARDYHDQERWEMKYFLPRVPELVSQFAFPYHSVEVIFMKLDLDQLAYCPLPEQKLRAAFSQVYVASCLATYPLPASDALADSLLMFGLAHVDMTPLLLA